MTAVLAWLTAWLVVAISGLMTAVLIDNSVEASGTAEPGSPRRRLIKVSNDVIYAFYQDATNDFGYQKSSDGGVTWGGRVGLGSGSATEIGWDIYYKRWTDAGSANIVDILTVVDAGTRGLYHQQLNLDTDTVGTLRLIFGMAGFSGACGGFGIGVARSGRIYATGAGAPFGGSVMLYSDDEGVNWTSAPVSFTIHQDDRGRCDMWADFSSSDPDDICAIYIRGDTYALSIKQYDASLGTITNTAIGTLTDLTDDFANTSSAMTSAGVIKVAAVDTVGTPASIKTWTVTGASVTARTNVLTTTARVYNVALSIMSTGRIICWYCRDSAGAASTAIELYYKYSDDDMVTWSAEQSYGSRDQDIIGILADPRPTGTTAGAAWFEGDTDDLYIEAPFPGLVPVAMTANLALTFTLTGTLTGTTTTQPPIVLKCAPLDGVQVIRSSVDSVRNP